VGCQQVVFVSGARRLRGHFCAWRELAPAAEGTVRVGLCMKSACEREEKKQAGLQRF
jgi:hypothetical protein